jgi:hypothetical protein
MDFILIDPFILSRGAAGDEPIGQLFWIYQTKSEETNRTSRQKLTLTGDDCLKHCEWRLNILSFELVWNGEVIIRNE